MHALIVLHLVSQCYYVLTEKGRRIRDIIEQNATRIVWNWLNVFIAFTFDNLVRNVKAFTNSKLYE